MARELDREIAERLGYQVERIDTNPLTGQETWCLIDPADERHYAPMPAAGTAAGVWDALAPCFSTDMDLALTLVPQGTSERTFMLRQIGGQWLASITDITLGRETVFEEQAPRPEEAICRAWLKWKRGCT